MMTEPDARRLRAALGAVADLLGAAGEAFWADKARTALGAPDAGQMAGTARQWFGGMGSFNDLILSPDNGHAGSAAQLDAANLRLQALSSEIFQLSQAARL